MDLIILSRWLPTVLFLSKEYPTQHTVWETFPLPICFPQQMRCYSILSAQQTPRHPEIQHPHSGIDGPANQPSRLRPNPGGSVVLSHNSVTHTPSFAVSGVYQPPSSQETLPPLQLFHLIMHLHPAANKPSKSAVQNVRPKCAKSMLTTQTENSSCDDTDASSYAGMMC